MPDAWMPKDEDKPVAAAAAEVVASGRGSGSNNDWSIETNRNKRY